MTPIPDSQSSVFESSSPGSAGAAFEGSGVDPVSLIQDTRRSRTVSRIRSTAINWTIPVFGLNNGVEERHLRKLNRGWDDLVRPHVNQVADLFADQSQQPAVQPPGSAVEWPTVLIR